MSTITPNYWHRLSPPTPLRNPTSSKSNTIITPGPSSFKEPTKTPKIPEKSPENNRLNSTTQPDALISAQTNPHDTPLSLHTFMSTQTDHPTHSNLENAPPTPVMAQARFEKSAGFDEGLKNPPLGTTPDPVATNDIVLAPKTLLETSEITRITRKRLISNKIMQNHQNHLFSTNT